MSNLQKINSRTNIITWFEIPALDLYRAQRFYETILDIQMPIRKDGPSEAAFFPYDPAIMQASSGRVTGSIVQYDNHNTTTPATGVVVYLNASPLIQTVLDKVQKAGGEIITDKFLIPPGWIAKIKDTEGNIIGLFAEQ